MSYATSFFSHVGVGLDYLITHDEALNDHFCIFLLYVTTLEIEYGSWPTESKLNLCIG